MRRSARRCPTRPVIHSRSSRRAIVWRPGDLVGPHPAVAPRLGRAVVVEVAGAQRDRGRAAPARARRRTRRWRAGRRGRARPGWSAPAATCASPSGAAAGRRGRDERGLVRPRRQTAPCRGRRPARALIFSVAQCGRKAGRRARAAGMRATALTGSSCRQPICCAIAATNARDAAAGTARRRGPARAAPAAARARAAGGASSRGEASVRAVSGAYVHGYREREGERLADQAGTLVELLHGDTALPRRAAPCWRPAAAWARRPSRWPRAAPRRGSRRWTSRRSRWPRRARRVEEAGLANVELRQADMLDPPVRRRRRSTTCSCASSSSTCPTRPRRWRRLAALVRPGGSVTVIEGDHGSAYFHPDSAAAARGDRLPGPAAGRRRRRRADRPPGVPADGGGRPGRRARVAADGLRGRRPARAGRGLHAQDVQPLGRGGARARLVGGPDRRRRGFDAGVRDLHLARPRPTEPSPTRSSRAPGPLSGSRSGSGRPSPGPAPRPCSASSRAASRPGR